MVYNNRQEALRCIVLNHPLAKRYIGIYIDLDTQIVDIKALRIVAQKWTVEERFLLYLGLNLFGIETIKVDLNRINQLDEKARELALLAIRIRYDLV